MEPAFVILISQTNILPLQVDTKTTDSSNLFASSMMVQDENGTTDPLFKNSALGTDDNKQEKSPDPLNTTITTIPEPQRASAPNVAGEHLCMINETIVAGFNAEAIKKDKDRKDIEVSPVSDAENENEKMVKKKEDANAEVIITNKDVPNNKAVEKIQPTMMRPENKLKAKYAEKKCLDDEVHNNTYCNDWVMRNPYDTANVTKGVSDLVPHDVTSNDLCSSSLQDLTSVSHKVQRYNDIKWEEYFYLKKSAQKKKNLQEKKQESSDNM